MSKALTIFLCVHLVQALTMSVSVNVFSENSIKLAAQEILMRPPPPSLRHSW
jgi:hypothetical protein